MRLGWLESSRGGGGGYSSTICIIVESAYLIISCTLLRHISFQPSLPSLPINVQYPRFGYGPFTEITGGGGPVFVTHKSYKKCN